MIRLVAKSVAGEFGRKANMIVNNVDEFLTMWYCWAK